MNPLEKKIIELLPLLSEEAKFKARVVLGENPSSNKQEENVTDEDVHLAMCKFLKI
jgi:hypothetical protein